MAWVETVSASFRARHESADADDVARALGSLEATRARLEIVFPRTAADVTVVFHRSAPLLDLAHPLVPVERRLTAPAARRYVVGSTGGAQTIHVLAPQALRVRASAVPGSREMLERAPDVLYARLVVGVNNRRLPRPRRPVACSSACAGRGSSRGRHATSPARSSMRARRSRAACARASAPRSRRACATPRCSARR
jgi:hypothetical protein